MAKNRAPAATPPLGTAVDDRRTARRPTVFLFVILTAQLMVVLDTTIVNVALPHVQRALGFSGASLSWVLNAYLLAFGGLLLLGARAGDLIGRRRTFLLGIAVFAGSSLLGGLAVTGWQLLVTRALQGVGAALAAPSALALLTTTFSEGAQRTRAIGLFTAVSAAGGAVGLVLGGVLTELVSWRWVMFVNVPIGLAVLLVAPMVLTETETRHGHFDLAGALTSTIGMTAIVLGLVEAASRGFADRTTLGALALGALALAAFVHVESRASEPILPLHLFTNATRTAANVSRGLLYAGMFGMFFFLGQYLQDVQGYSPLRAGLSFLPVPASVFLSSQLTSRVLSARVGTKRLMLAGSGSALASLLLLTQLHHSSPYLQVLVSLVLMGMGSGTALVTLTSASLADVAPDEAGAASGLVNVVQQVGAALGLAVLVTVSSATTSASAAATAARTGVPAGLSHGLDTVFAASSLFAVAALVLIAVAVRLPATTSVRVLRADARASDELEALADLDDDREWVAADAVA